MNRVMETPLFSMVAWHLFLVGVIIQRLEYINNCLEGVKHSKILRTCIVMAVYS